MPWTVEKQYVLELDQPLQPPVTRTVHRDGTATMASGSVISKGSLVGRGSIVESGTRLERSIIGSDCHIGRCAFLQGSCLHGGVRVDDSCLVSSAVLGERVVVRAHARVEVRSWWPTWLRSWGRSRYDIVCLLKATFQISFYSCCGQACCARVDGLRLTSVAFAMQTGAVLATHTVVDTAHSVPAGIHVSLIQRKTCGAGSDDEVEWREAGGDGRRTSSLQVLLNFHRRSVVLQCNAGRWFTTPWDFQFRS